MTNPLLDKDFMKQLHEYSEREVYAKIIALDIDNNPIEEIVGYVTQGSISVDGTSAVRRTCSLTMVAQGVDINEYYWGLNTKVKIFVGLKNFINPKYPDIIWFPQGIYLLTTFNTSQNVQGYSISLQGKDKMCLLNGDIGGLITAVSVDFGKIEVEDTDENGYGLGTYSKQDYLLKDIIKEVVHVYAKEPYHNIVIKDLDDVGLELFEYRGTTPLYLIVNNETNEVSQLTLRESDKKSDYVMPLLHPAFTPNSLTYNTETSVSETHFWIQRGGAIEKCVLMKHLKHLNDYANTEKIYYSIRNYPSLSTTFVDDLNGTDVIDYLFLDDLVPVEPFALKDLQDDEFDERLNLNFQTANHNKKIVYSSIESNRRSAYSFIKVTTGETVGYRITDLTYAGELIGNVGNAITGAVLDPIVKQLGDFEYFYDDNGTFIFQKKQTYLNTSWNNLNNSEVEFYPVNLIASEYTPGSYYVRENGEYVPSYSSFQENQIYYMKGSTEACAQANAFAHSYTYSFENSNLITAFNNTPALNNVKNDYAIWGVRKGISGAEIPIHTRYAIDKKPISFTNYEGETYTVLTKEEAQEEQIQQKLHELENTDFHKHAMPACLDPDDWWEVHDWAEYYHSLTGEFPEESMGHYITEWTQMDLNLFFPAGYSWNKDWPLFLFDVEENGQLGFAGHNPCSSNYIISDDKTHVMSPGGYVYDNENFCGHAYQGYFVERNITAYFYKPTIPGRKYDDDIKEIVREQIDHLYASYHYNCEWREVLYQMAKDNLKHGHKDDYLATVAAHNPNAYPTGVTGYEQYYTDMIGFWRQLYNPHLDKIELYDFTELTAASAQQFFKDGNHTSLYKIVDEYHEPIGQYEEYNSKYKYYQKQSEDIAHLHPSLKYYQISEDGTGYDELEEKYVTRPRDIPSDVTFYYKDGSDYFPYRNFNKSEAYYTHMVIKDFQGLDPFAEYINEKGKKIKFSTVPVYDIVTDFDSAAGEKQLYYKYNILTGAYESYGKITGFSPKNTYYLKREYPIIFPNNEKLYIDNGYKPAERLLTPGVEYFTRDTILNPGQSTYYRYTSSFILPEDQKLFIADDSGWYETTEFTRGHTYNTENGIKITIPDVTLYYKDGIKEVYRDSINKVSCINTLTANDRTYYIDDNGNKNYLPDGAIILGKINYCYCNDTAKIIADDTFEEGYYYVYLPSLGYIRSKILKTFNRNKDYYIVDGAEYVLSEKPFDDKTAYYLQSVNSDTGAIIGYAAYEDILDFTKEVTILDLFILDDDKHYSLTGGIEGPTGIWDDKANRYVVEQHRLIPIDRAHATYNPSLQYYVRGDDRKYYPIFEKLTKDNFKKNIWHLYERNKDLDYHLYKHMDYTPTPYLVQIEDTRDVVSLKGEYYASNQYDPQTYWTVDLKTPEILNFWIDFLDTDGEISRYSNYMIGNRPKIENDSKVNAIYYRETPQVIFVNEHMSDTEYELQRQMKPGYTFIRITDALQNLFTISSQGKTTQDVLAQDLYANTYCTESVSITCLPVYHLQPNTRILIKDEKSGINGEYIISRITIPLTYNGTMNISAVKAVERFN